MKITFQYSLLFLLLLNFTFINTSFAQSEKYTISGQIKDALNGEDASFTNVYVKGEIGLGTSSNVYGFYSLSLPAGTYTIVYQFIGYKTLEKEIILDKNIKLDVEIEPAVETIDEVVISAEKEDQNITRNEGSVTKISMKDVKAIPTFGGEPDIMKVAQMTPGVKTAGEGNSGFYVRGGGIDQNLVLIDEAPVYNPSHLLGFFSVFNGDALKGATLYKGGMPAEYGGRTASVMDIRMKDGNSKKLSATGGLGLIASRLTIEAPIVKDKGSFMISGRRTYADLFLKLSSKPELKDTKLYFYDLNLKANYRISEKDRLYFSGYFGRDEFGLGDTFSLGWGNATGTVRWNHTINDKIFSNTSLIYSDYDFKFGFGNAESGIGLESVIRDINVKQDFSYYPNTNNKIKLGFNVIHHTIEPGNLIAGESSGFSSVKAEPGRGIESAIYIQNEQKLTTRLSVNYGLRYSLFNRIGKGTEYEFDNEGEYLSEENYEAGEKMTSYGGFEPRLSANFSLNELSSLKLGYNRNQQYLHLLSTSASTSPSDVWVMSSNNIKPQTAQQISLGYFRNFKKNTYEFSAETYYKEMKNVIDYRTGADIFLNDQLEGEIVYGEGEAYGLELYLKKTKGKFTGWIGYTLSKTLRTIEQINDGEPFSAKQDRTHDLSFVAMYQLSEKLILSGNFVYYTGDAVTFPTGQYVVEGIVVPYYTERNGYRMPDYHRMDLGLTWNNKKTDKYESSWNFSVYNLYARENAFSIEFRPSEDDPTINEAVQTSLFKAIPSITYNFKF